ncbi:MAG: CBS domain-containing protein [Paracoccaceae bacterium]|nr:CBS domain-containing protein [Paracoccaceae bacterium]
MSATLVQTVSERLCHTIIPTKFLTSAIEKLVDHRIGALPVVDQNKALKGIISERDIIRQLKVSDNFRDLQVESVMTRNVITCTVDARANEIMELMTKYRIRHIPITEGKKLLGIISIGDVVSRLLEKYKMEAELLKSYINS